MPGHYGNGNGNGNRTTPTTRTTSNDNPVIRLFNAPATPRYFRPNGIIVPVGARLHEHQDGTIMTEHSMGPDDNSVVVFEVTNDNLNPPDENEGSENNGMNGNTPPPDITPPPGNGGGNGMNQGGGSY